jgi:choline dehydrogenase
MSWVERDDLRVHGVTGPRAADAPVMPSIVSTNTQAAVLAIAEQAEALLERRPVGAKK